MKALLGNRIVSAALPRAILFGLIGASLVGVVVANTLTSTNLGNGSIKLGKETFSDDTDVVVTSKRIFKLSNADAGPASGDTAPGVESTNALPQVNNALVKNKYAYEFEMKEAAVTSWQSGEDFKIEVYMDNGTTNSLLATLYSQQTTVDDSSVEGVTVTVNTGEANILGDIFSIIITRQ